MVLIALIELLKIFIRRYNGSIKEEEEEEVTFPTELGMTCRPTMYILFMSYLVQFDYTMFEQCRPTLKTKL